MISRKNAIKLFIVFLTALTSCKKSSNDDNDNTPQPTQPTQNWWFKADVDGITLSADSAKGYLIIDSTGSLFPSPALKRMFMIDGYFQNKFISPFFGDSLLSENLLGPSVDSSIIHFPGLDYQDWNSPSGQDYNWITAYFEVTNADTVNKSVSGSFSGMVVGDVLQDTVALTNGSFSNIKYEALQ